MADRQSGARREDKPPARASSSTAVSGPEQPGHPVLTEPQLAVLRRYGNEQTVAIGDVLYAAGERTYDLIVVLDCEIQMIERYGQPGEAVIAQFGPREFLGEIRLLTGQRAYLTAVV